jgi:hypothetical protein
VAWFVKVRQEAALASDQQADEADTFRSQWSTFADGLAKKWMGKRLGEEWIPQMDRRTSATYYMNLKSGKQQKEHPHMRHVRAAEKAEGAKAEAQLSARIETLKSYQDALLQTEASSRAVLVSRAQAVKFALLCGRDVPTFEAAMHLGTA